MFPATSIGVSHSVVGLDCNRWFRAAHLLTSARIILQPTVKCLRIKPGPPKLPILEDILKATIPLSCVWLLASVATLLADSHAYVLSNNGSPGSLTPLSISGSAFGPGEFVPAGGNILVAAPGTGQLWEGTTAPFNINILNPGDGTVLATMPMSGKVNGLAFDSAGAYAYATLSNGDLIQISVAQRAITQTVPHFGGIQLQVSTDGTKLFVIVDQTVFQLDTQTLTVLNSFRFSGSVGFKVVGATLLICDSSGLSYYDTTTFLPIRPTVSLPAGSFFIDVSPDGARIYIQNIQTGTSGTQTEVELLNYATGALLTSTTLPAVNGVTAFLSPDGQHLLLLDMTSSMPAGDSTFPQIQILNAHTLATTSFVSPAEAPRVVCFLDNDTLLILTGAAGAMTVVDQASAQVIDSFPVGAQGLEPALVTADGESIFVGMDHPSNLLEIDTSLDRIANILLLNVAFYPYGLAGNQLYGGPPNVQPAWDIHLMSGNGSLLPRVPNPPSCPEGCLIAYGVGGLPPNGKTFWMPFMATDGVGTPWAQGLAIYSTVTNTILEELPLPLCCLAGPIAFGPASAYAYLAVGSNILVYNAKTLKYVTAFTVPAPILSLAVAPAGNYLYALTGTSAVVLSVTNGATLHTWTLPDAAQSMAVSPDGRALFLTVANPSSLDILKVTTGNLTQVPLPYPPTSVVVVKN